MCRSFVTTLECLSDEHSSKIGKYESLDKGDDQFYEIYKYGK